MPISRKYKDTIKFIILTALIEKCHFNGMLAKSKCAFHVSKVGNICSFQKLQDILPLEARKLRTESTHLANACCEELLKS